MHEAAIAESLLEQVEQQAATHGVSRVEEIELEIGAFELIVPEALATAFAMAAEGGVAEGARLRMVEIAPAARCRACDARFTPELADYRCPDCGQANAELTAGRGIVLKSLQCQTA